MGCGRGQPGGVAWMERGRYVCIGDKHGKKDVKRTQNKTNSAHSYRTKTRSNLNKTRPDQQDQ